MVRTFTGLYWQCHDTSANLRAQKCNFSHTECHCLPHKNATAFIDNSTTPQRLQTEQRDLAHTEKKELTDRLAWGREDGEAVASYGKKTKTESHDRM